MGSFTICGGPIHRLRRMYSSSIPSILEHYLELPWGTVANAWTCETQGFWTAFGCKLLNARSSLTQISRQELA